MDPQMDTFLLEIFNLSSPYQNEGNQSLYIMAILVVKILGF